jgi:hypothetical protein
LIVAISFASILMAHHASIFGNVMWRTTSQIQDVRGRGNLGVERAERLYKGTTRIKSAEA